MFRGERKKGRRGKRRQRLANFISLICRAESIANIALRRNTSYGKSTQHLDTNNGTKLVLVVLVFKCNYLQTVNVEYM